MPALPHPSRLLVVAFVLAALGVAWFSLAPEVPAPVAGYSDKLQHFAAYGVLMLLGLAAGARPWLVLGAAVVAFGAGVEVLQGLVPSGRTGSVLDGVANALGVGAASAAWWVVERVRDR